MKIPEFESQTEYAKYVTETVRRYTEISKREGKPVIIAAILTELPLEKEIEEHFKNPDYTYVFELQPRKYKDRPEDLYMGVWLTENLDYFHLVLVTKEVLLSIVPDENTIFDNTEP